jgi:hypothetical protein
MENAGSPGHRPVHPLTGPVHVQVTLLSAGRMPPRKSMPFGDLDDMRFPWDFLYNFLPEFLCGALMQTCSGSCLTTSSRRFERRQTTAASTSSSRWTVLDNASIMSSFVSDMALCPSGQANGPMMFVANNTNTNPAFFKPGTAVSSQGGTELEPTGSR